MTWPVAAFALSGLVWIAAATDRGALRQEVVSAGATAESSGRRVSGTGAISGLVTDGRTGKGIPGAIVSLAATAAGDPNPSRTMTDSRGRFVFFGLASSSGYYLSAEAFGYPPGGYGWIGPGGSSRDLVKVPLADGQWMSTADVVMWPFAAITGLVVDEFGDPVVGTAVRAYSLRRIAGHVYPVAGPTVATDDRGLYRLAGLVPGSYTVAVLSVQSTVLDTMPKAAAQHPFGTLLSSGVTGSGPASVDGATIAAGRGHRLVVTNFAVPPSAHSSTSEQAYPQLFYPGVRLATDAMAVVVGYGDIRGGIDFRLVPVATAQVSGRVDGFSGRAPQMLLRLLPAGSESLGVGSEAATTMIDADGRFTFLNVPSGAYTVVAQAGVADLTTADATVRVPDPPGFPGGPAGIGTYESAPGIQYLQRYGAPSEYWGRASVTVGEADVGGVVLALHPTVSVRGRAVFAEGTAPPPAARPLVVNAFAANGDPTLGTPFGMTETDGTFRFSVSGLLSGTYLLRGFAGYGIVSAVYQGRDILETGIDTSAGVDINDVVVTLTDKKTTVSGLVRGIRGGIGADVILFPAQRDLWVDFGLRPLRFRSVRTDSSGSYLLSAIPAGQYLLIAVEPSKLNTWLSAEFLDAAASRSTRVTVRWGDRLSQGLVVSDVVVK